MRISHVNSRESLRDPLYAEKQQAFWLLSGALNVWTLPGPRRPGRLELIKGVQEISMYRRLLKDGVGAVILSQNCRVD